MNIKYHNLSPQQKNTAIQRLTALWAFSESGLGGIMHAFQVPFTGLVLGGLAVIIISFIAQLSEVNYQKMLHSLVIVLIIKAMVSPNSPFPAYIAVSFQAMLGYILFYFIRVNFFSLLLLSILAMLESAFQQLLILTLFFGRSLWKAMDQLFAFTAGQFGLKEMNGSQWVVSLYLFIYVLGGVIIALMAYRIIRGFFSTDTAIPLSPVPEEAGDPELPASRKKKKNLRQLWMITGVMLIVSLLLYLFAPENKTGWMAVIKTIAWTLSAILAWYLVISPLFTKFILQVLQKKQSRYSEEVAGIISLLPVLRKLTRLAWKKSGSLKGWNRWVFFLTTLLNWSLTYTDIPATANFAKEKS